MVDKGLVAGVAPKDYAASASETERRAWHSVSDVMRRDFVYVRKDEMLADIVARMHHPHAAIAVVCRSGGTGGVDADVVGIVTWEQTAEVQEEAVDLFSESPE